MAENWVPVRLEDGKYAINGNNIVVQHLETTEIGYVEDTLDNRQLFGVGETDNCSPQSPLTLVSQDEGYATSSNKIEWGDETKFLLDLYYDYLPRVGPMKKFRSKKRMWDQISEDINNKLNINRTAVQCESRFKTIKKRKIASQLENQVSGNSPTNIPFLDEFDKIKSIDDSVEPEVLMDVTHKVVNTKPSTSQEGTQGTPKRSIAVRSYKTKNDIVAETLILIHKEKEQSREKRHQEKMELLQALINKQKTCNCNN